MRLLGVRVGQAACNSGPTMARPCQVAVDAGVDPHPSAIGRGCAACARQFARTLRFLPNHRVPFTFSSRVFGRAGGRVLGVVCALFCAGVAQDGGVCFYPLAHGVCQCGAGRLGNAGRHLGHAQSGADRRAGAVGLYWHFYWRHGAVCLHEPAGPAPLWHLVCHALDDLSRAGRPVFGRAHERPGHAGLHLAGRRGDDGDCLWQARR